MLTNQILKKMKEYFNKNGITSNHTSLSKENGISMSKTSVLWGSLLHYSQLPRSGNNLRVH
jgi:hypothetical protein